MLGALIVMYLGVAALLGEGDYKARHSYPKGSSLERVYILHTCMDPVLDKAISAIADTFPKKTGKHQN